MKTIGLIGGMSWESTIPYYRIINELTVRFAEDGCFQYLGNEILNDGIMHIPDYQYRIKE